MPGIIEVTAKKDGNEATIQYDFGADLAEMVEKFGENVTFTQARAQMKIVLQAAMRRRLKADQPCEDLVENWKPGVQMERTFDLVAAFKAVYAKADEEERAKMLQQLRDM
jgi:hypothetical protein